MKTEIICAHSTQSSFIAATIKVFRVRVRVGVGGQAVIPSMRECAHSAQSSVIAATIDPLRCCMRWAS